MQKLLGYWQAVVAGMPETWLVVLGAVLGAVALLLLPVPGLVLDALLFGNLAMSVVLCARAARAGEPLRMPQLPALLLVSVLLRLGTNVAALRMILGGAGESGSVLLRSGGDLLFLGDALVGAVLTAALLAVEYLVLARGGERVAEVAARFVLDALPGRQAAIEADLRSGAVDQTRAQELRLSLDREAQIYGALDGALRLLKGDVTSALLLLLAGLFGGLLLGVLRHGLPLGEAAERYALYVVGLGLFSQVPVLLNTAAAGLLLTRGAHVKSTGQEAAPARGDAAISIEAGRDLNLDAAALPALRESLSSRLGFALPGMALGAPIAGRRLQVRLHGAPLFSGELPPDGDARTALGEAILGAAADLLSLDTVQEAVLSLQRQVPALVRETVPRRIDLGRLTAILRRLLAQRVWPVDVRAVLETVATLPRLEPELDALTEQVRGGLGRFLVKGLLRGSGDVSTGGAAAEGLPALLLSSEIEELLREARRSDGEPGLFLEPELARDIVEGVQSGKKMAPEAVLLCHADVRRSVEELLAGAPGAPPVLAYSEVPASVPVVVLGRVEPGADARASSDERTTPFIDSAAVPWQMRSPKVGRL